MTQSMLIESIIPAVIFGIIIIHHVRDIASGLYTTESDKDPKGALGFFSLMRHGWIDQNHLTGQAACNTTRDYIRIVVFLAGNAILCASILSGFAVRLKPSESFGDLILLIKLGACVVTLIAIFILMLICMRYMLHFRYLR